MVVAMTEQDNEKIDLSDYFGGFTWRDAVFPVCSFVGVFAFGAGLGWLACGGYS